MVVVIPTKGGHYRSPYWIQSMGRLGKNGAQISYVARMGDLPKTWTYCGWQRLMCQILEWQMVQWTKPSRTFRAVFKLAKAKEAAIANVFSSGAPQWNIDFTKATQDWELETTIKICTALYSISIIEGTIDQINWSPSKKGRFTFKSLYQVLMSLGMTMCSHGRKSIWQMKTPSKAAFFVRTTSLTKILSTNNLRKCWIMVQGGQEPVGLFFLQVLD